MMLHENAWSSIEDLIAVLGGAEEDECCLSEHKERAVEWMRGLPSDSPVFNCSVNIEGILGPLSQD